MLNDVSYYKMTSLWVRLCFIIRVLYI